MLSPRLLNRHFHRISKPVVFQCEMRSWRRTLQLLSIFKGGNIMYIRVGRMRCIIMGIKWLVSAFLSDSAGSWRREPQLTGRSRPFGTGNGKQPSDLTKHRKAICQDRTEPGGGDWLSLLPRQRRHEAGAQARQTGVWLLDKLSVSVTIRRKGTRIQSSEAV